MDAAAVVASIVLGLAFVVAGASKIAAGELWPAQAQGLGAPGWTIPIVPWVELVLGAMAIAQVARPLAALASLALLVVFTGLIVDRLRRGERPSCACFGAWSARPIGAGHVVRNAALIAVAIVAAL